MVKASNKAKKTNQACRPSMLLAVILACGHFLRLLTLVTDDEVKDDTRGRIPSSFKYLMSGWNLAVDKPLEAKLPWLCGPMAWRLTN